MKSKRKRRIALLILCVLILTEGAVSAVLYFRPDVYIRLMQANGFVEGDANCFEAENEDEDRTLENGIRFTGNISYESRYPNGFLDLYRTSSGDSGEAPLFFYIHGGGYVGGDKAEGDPAAASSDIEDTTRYLQQICMSGYNVVSINYALAPDYNYPVPVLQIDEAVRFLVENQDTYGIDMSHVVFSGGSAGGQLAGQYVNIQTNEEYAEQMGMEQTLGTEGVLGIVLNSALLEPVNFARTDSFTNNFMFFEMRQQYFSGDSGIMEEADVIKNLSADFPPAYITDGNYGTFDRQAARLDQRLDELGVYHIFNYYDRSTAELPHGYDSYLDNEYAQENLDKTLDFLQKLKEGTGQTG